MWAALQGMLALNTDSFTPRLGGLGLPGPVARFAEDCGMDDAFELDRALRDPWVRDLLSGEGADVKTASNLVGLAVFRGIGSEHALALQRIGIGSVEDLKGKDPGELARRLAGQEGGGQPVRAARVKVWIKAASRQSAGL
jgi:hypothetical protein